ncbi:MAG: glycerophosphodiester phosphodiesterase [Acidobacteriota bacterium]
MCSVRPLVFAHRGGAALAPENTIAAFDNGLELGADGLELDVQLSRDGVPVVIHDPTLERTTDGAGPLTDWTARELASVDAGYRFTRDGQHPFRGRGIGIPALADVLVRYPRTPLIIELKARDVRLARSVVDAIRAAGAVGHVTVGSFHQGALDAVRAYDPAIRTGADIDEVRSGLAAEVFGRHRSRVLFHAFQVPEVYAGDRIVTPTFVERAHDAGASVIVWTVDREDDVRRLLDWGVDGIITDRPDAAVPAVRHWLEERSS